MRRRLTVALLGVALLAVVLLGAGVLLLAQIGARQEAERQVDRQLTALAEVAGQLDTPERIRPALGRLAEGFDLPDARLVAVRADGRVLELSPPGVVLEQLDQEQRDQFRSAEPVLLSGRRQVTGVIRLHAVGGRGRLADADLAVLVRHDISPVAAEARLWFVLSAGVVLVAAALVSRWLATRFSRPLEAIEAATARIAAGDLSVRVAAEGVDEFGQLGRAVNRMTEHLEHAQSAEQEFLLSVSHDLRTPLTAIRGYAEALQDGAVDDPTRAGSVISDHADRLNRLVGDLLDLARINRSEFRLESANVALAPLVGSVLDGLEPRAAESEVVLERHLPDAIALGDSVRLEQVVANLVDNALKFAEGRIRVSITPAAGLPARDALVDSSRDQAPVVSITVSDDGPGIDAVDLPHVFERLYVTRARPRRAENSSGIGLAIVRQLVTAMGGEVAADRDPSLGGTRMTVRLPAGVT